MNCKRCIFSADDNPVYREALKKALWQSGSTYQMTEVFYGREVFLKQNKRKSKAILPAPLIISRQTLHSSREYITLSDIPVVMYTSATYHPSDTLNKTGKIPPLLPNPPATMPFGCNWPASEYPNH